MCLQRLRLLIVPLGRAGVPMAEEGRGKAYVLRVLYGEGGGGRVSEKVRVDGLSEPFLGALPDLVVEQATSASARSPPPS